VGRRAAVAEKVLAHGVTVSVRWGRSAGSGADEVAVLSGLLDLPPPGGRRGIAEQRPGVGRRAAALLEAQRMAGLAPGVGQPQLDVLDRPLVALHQDGVEAAAQG